MTVTPWGKAEELCARRLRPGPAASREQVDRNQRERLYGAMVAAVAEKGYERTRVSDLLSISGVSRNTFYRHFANKEACFLATLDAVIAVGREVLAARFATEDGTWEERLRTGMTTLIELIVEHRASARLYYVETYAMGRDAIERVERTGDRIEQMVKIALDQSPNHVRMPPMLLRAVLRSFRRVIQTRVRAGSEGDLLVEGPQLLEWALGYHAPPQRLRRPRKLPPIEFRAPPDEDARDRILTAVIELMAETGYQELTITGIARRAAISLTTFYMEFDGKDAAIVEALRRGASRVREAAGPALRDAPDWPAAVAGGVHAFFAFLELEQPFAQFSGVDVHSGSPAVVHVRDEISTAAQEFLARGRDEYPNVTPLIAEAIAAGVDAMLFDQIVRGGQHRLYALAPTATYLVLVPFVGVERACDIANASR